MEQGPVRAGYLVGRVDRMVRSSLRDAVVDADLSVPEYTALSVLAARPGLSNARLARRALVTSQAMHKVTLSLEERGLLRRAPLVDRGRALGAQLTERGLRLLESLEPQVQLAEDRVLSVLSPDERVELLRLLRIVGQVDLADEPQ